MIPCEVINVKNEMKLEGVDYFLFVLSSSHDVDDVMFLCVLIRNSVQLKDADFSFFSPSFHSFIQSSSSRRVLMEHEMIRSLIFLTFFPQMMMMIQDD